MTFDTLTYAKQLKRVGFTEEQAEALADLLNEKLATKQDLKDLEERLEMHLIFKLSAVMVVVVGLFTGLLGVFIRLVH